MFSGEELTNLHSWLHFESVGFVPIDLPEQGFSKINQRGQGFSLTRTQGG